MRFIFDFINRRIDSRLFALLILVLVFLPFGWQAYAPTFRINTLIKDTPRGDYLASLQLRTLEGCLLMREMRPDVLVLGDSYSYSGFDFVVLEKALAPLRVGQCSIGAAFLETFDQWLTFLEQGDYRPKEIIYGVSLRMFVESSRKEKRRAIVDKFLFNSSFKARTIGSWFDRNPPFGNTLLAFEETLSFQTPRINKLSERQIEGVIQRSTVRYFRAWKQRRDWKIITEHTRTIDGYCSRLRRMGIGLKIIHIPISPRGWRIYTDKQIAQYESLLNHFSKCASLVVLPSETASLGENRHFVNRYMLPGYDYTFWRKQKPDFGSKPRRIFDISHMNSVGARKFTKWFVERAYQ